MNEENTILLTHLQPATCTSVKCNWKTCSSWRSDNELMSASITISIPSLTHKHSDSLGQDKSDHIVKQDGYLEVVQLRFANQLS